MHIKSEDASKTNVNPPLPKGSLRVMQAALVSSLARGHADALQGSPQGSAGFLYLLMIVDAKVHLD